MPALSELRAIASGRLGDIPIRRKLLLIIILAVGLAIVVATAAVSIYETRTFRPRTLDKMETQAGILVEIMVPPLQFNDPATAADYLGTLRHWPEISRAALFDSKGKLFAEYRRDGEDAASPPLPRPPIGARFEPRNLIYAQEVLDAGRRIGYLAFHQDLPPLYARLPQYGIMFGVVFLSLMAVSAMLAFGLKYGITTPITALAGTAKAVTERKDYRMRAAPVGRDEVGALTGAFNQMLDTLEQQDLSLRESRNLLQSIIDNSPAVIYVKDPEGRYLLVNRRFEAIFRINKDQILGRTDLDIMPREKADANRSTDQQALAADRPMEFEDTAVMDDGPHVFLNIKSRLRDPTGRPYAVCGISTDITHIKAYEERLRQAQKMEAIGRLAGGISHDFNNLLTAINGYSTMALEDKGLPARLQVFLNEILKAGERAAGLTRQLLAYSRKQVLETRVWDLNEIVSDMEKMLHRLIGEDVQLLTELSPGLGHVRIDRGQMEQIILNLVLNARDAMPSGGKLTVSTKNLSMDRSAGLSTASPAAGRYVVLTVVDTGTGMSQDVIEHIFEPFFTTKEVGKGTGLGLSVVYGIVNQSGGTISVFSEPGKGTTFTLYLPETPPQVEAPRDVPASAQTHSRRGSETLLLVEDDALVRKFASHALQSLGYTVLEAVNGTEALKTIDRRTGPLHMVITDVVMPDMGGPALAERIRKAFPAIPILFISGYAESTVIQNGLIGKLEKFLQKPFIPDELARKVREALDLAEPEGDEESGSRERSGEHSQ